MIVAKARVLDSDKAALVDLVIRVSRLNESNAYKGVKACRKMLRALILQNGRDLCPHIDQYHMEKFSACVSCGQVIAVREEEKAPEGALV